MKKTIAAIGLSLMMATGHSAELSSVDVTKFNAAVKAYRMNQNTKALRLFNELYNDYPQNQQIKNNYAVVLFSNGKLEQAEEVLSSLIESNKDVNVAYRNLNKIYDYAAAKAYSNALGTEKEVTPQKLQIIETIQASSTAVANTVPSTAESAKVASADPAANKPVAKNAPSDTGNNVQVWADNWSKTDVNSYVAATLKDAAEPAAEGAVVPAVLNQATKNAGATIPVATEQAAKVTPAAPTATPTVDEAALVEEAVRNWAQAWSKGDADSYITYYEPTFRLGKMSHNQWIKNRKDRVTPAANIDVKLSDLIVTPSKTDDTMAAYFKQDYKANNYQDKTSKQLIWKKIGDKWFIKKEINLN